MTPEVGAHRRCSYIIPKKKRSCRMLVKPGRLYCGEHAIFDPENKDRIPCPNDPKHTVLRQDLEEHLKTRCNSRLLDEPWIKENFNLDPSMLEHTRHQEDSRPSEELLRLVADIVVETYKSIESRVQERILETELIEKCISKETKTLGQNKIKHLKQLSSIIGYLTQHSLITTTSKNACIIELGSGKAQLCYWMAKILPNCRFLLVDRSGTRNKKENLACHENPDLEVTRLRCSIEHLDLSSIDFLKNSSHIVAVCKHFCGAATDFGIQCITNGIRAGLYIDGFALTPCCHHRCEYSQYTGREYLKSIRITDELAFDALRHLSTWATCGFQHASDTESTNVPRYENAWSTDQKVQLGRMAKVLLEIGRIHHLDSLGFDVQLYRYTDLSLESLLILGKRV